jgi:hypothetical protein
VGVGRRRWGRLSGRGGWGPPSGRLRLGHPQYSTFVLIAQAPGRVRTRRLARRVHSIQRIGRRLVSRSRSAGDAGRLGGRVMAAGRSIGPSGIPLGRSLLLPRSPLLTEFGDALRAIERVHGDGALPPIPVLPVPTLGSVRGRFRFGPAGPISIAINPLVDHVELAVVHEVGHFLDLEGFGQPGAFSSLSDAELQPWRVAVRATHRYQELAEVIAEAIAAMPERTDVIREPLLVEELWARWYAQYVALRSGNRSLLDAIEAFRGGNRAEGLVSRLLHWHGDDFDPVADAIEALFQEFGWRSVR